MKNKQLIIFVIIALISIVSISTFGCKGKSPTERKIPASQLPTSVGVEKLAVQEEEMPKVETPKYVYKSSGRRDPFVPLVGKAERPTLTVGETGPASASEVNIGTLTVTGLIWDKDKPYVLLRSPDGSSYIVTEKRLMDDRGRIIQGVAAVIKKDKVILIGKNNIVKELKFSTVREESE